MEPHWQISPNPSQEAVESVTNLYNAINLKFPEGVRNFESKWAAWHNICLKTPTSASLYACTQTDEFEAIKMLGPKIIQFVIFKLARDDIHQNSYGVFLYNALEFDTNYIVKRDRPLASHEELQRESSQLVELNYQRNKIVEERIAAWQRHHENNQIHSNSIIYTECEEYSDLLEMGPSIIPQIMLMYEENYEGFWHELLYEIIHGHKMGAWCYQKGYLIDMWCQFFNERGWNEIPVYTPSEFDRMMSKIDSEDEEGESFRQSGQQ